MKKWISIIMIFVLGMVLFSGCSTNEPVTEQTEKEEPAVEQTVNDEPVTVKYMTFSAAPDHIEDLDAMIAAFEELHPNIKVEYETVGWNDYFTKLQTMVASNTAPDTFELNYENFITYASKNALYNMDDLIAEDNNFDSSVFNKTALDSFEYNDSQYGLVESFSNVLLFYNKDLFDAADVAYPEASWTWSDELEAAQKLTDADAGVWGSFAPIQFWEFYKTIEQNGGKIFNDDKTQVLIDSKENIETLTWMIDNDLFKKQGICHQKTMKYYASCPDIPKLLSGTLEIRRIYYEAFN